MITWKAKASCNGLLATNDLRDPVQKCKRTCIITLCLSETAGVEKTVQITRLPKGWILIGPTSIFCPDGRCR